MYIYIYIYIYIILYYIILYYIIYKLQAPFTDAPFIELPTGQCCQRLMISGMFPPKSLFLVIESLFYNYFAEI